jgi:hypothetical protein
MAIEETLRIIDAGSSTLKSVATEAKATGAAFDHADHAAREMEDGISKAGQGAAKLRGVLSTVNPVLGDLAGFANDAFDALEVGASTSGALAPVLAVVAGALIPVGANLAVMARESDEAAARAAFLADHLHDLDQALRGLEDAQLDAAVATRAMTQAQADQEAVQLKAGRSVEDFRASQEKERAAAEESYFAADKWLKRIAVLPDVLSTAIDYYGGFTSAQEEATKTLGALDDVELRHQDIAAQTAAAEATVATATERREAATRSLTRAEAELAGMEDFRARMTKAIADRIAEFTDINAGMFATIEDRGLTALEEFSAAIENVVPSQAMTDLDQLAVAEADLVLAFSEGLLTLEDYTAATDRLADARSRLAEASAKAESASAVSATGEGITGGPQAGVNALGNAGPWGELIAGLIEMVTDLDNTLAGFQNYHEGLMNAIGNLPATIADNMGSIFSDSFATIIPDFIDSFTASFPELIGGMVGGIVGTTANLLISLIVELPIALIKGFLSIFTVDFWKGIGDAIVAAFNETFGGGPDDPLAGTSSSGKVSGRGGSGRDAGADRAYDAAHASRGSFDTGSSFVPRTGMYQLERGEEVLRAGGTGTSRQEARTGRTISSRLGYGAGGFQIHAVIQVDDEGLERGMRDARARGYAV